MLNKNVCPNCGQLYDTNLDKCPLCGTAPQVVDTVDPVQRKRITEAERKQRRAERKEAEQEARRRRKDEQFMQDAEEERLYEEREARRKEAKRRRKEEKKAARRSEAEPEAEQDVRQTPLAPVAPVAPVFTPAPARDGRKPMPEPDLHKDRKRVPRFFLILSVLFLAAALLAGGSYLLWKTGVAEISFYDELAAKKDAGTPSGTELPPADTVSHTKAHEGDPIPCTGITLSETAITLSEAGAQTQLSAELSPADTTDEHIYSSSDETVVKVSPVGIVTAMGPGSAVITVSCGSQSAVCTVTCDFPGNSQSTLPLDVTELTLNKDDMTFFAAGENYVLSITNIPVGTAIEWKSLDETVCTVDNGGHVVAVGPGTTRVVAKVGELSTECWVRCRFE